MKNTILCISLMIISVAAAAQQQYPLKKIYETRYRESPSKKYRDSTIRYSLTTIDSILSNNDTVFEIKHFDESWQYLDDTLFRHNIREQYYGGFMLNGKRAGRWKVGESRDVPGLVCMNAVNLYYNGSELFDEMIVPVGFKNGYDRHYFLRDTVDFYLPPSEFDCGFSPDSIFIKVTPSKSWIYIGNVLVDSTDTDWVGVMVSNMQLWNNRKYRIIMDSVKNAKN